MTTSRRRFLAAAAALPAAPSVLARTAATDWDETFDVVVVGSGVAGTVAAIAAAEKGAKVLMIEKLNRTGGIAPDDMTVLAVRILRAEEAAA